MNCHACGALAGYAEPVPGSDTKARAVCAACKGQGTWPVELADLAAAALFGASIPAPEG